MLGSYFSCPVGEEAVSLGVVTYSRHGNEVRRVKEVHIKRWWIGVCGCIGMIVVWLSMAPMEVFRLPAPAPASPAVTEGIELQRFEHAIEVNAKAEIDTPSQESAGDRAIDGDDVILAFNEQVRREESLEALLKDMGEAPVERILRIHRADIPQYAVLQDGVSGSGQRLVSAHVNGLYLARSAQRTIISDIPMGNVRPREQSGVMGCRVGAVIIASMANFTVISVGTAVEARCICSASECTTRLIEWKTKPPGKDQNANSPGKGIITHLNQLSRHQNANSSVMEKIIR